MCRLGEMQSGDATGHKHKKARSMAAGLLVFVSYLPCFRRLGGQLRAFLTQAVSDERLLESVIQSTTDLIGHVRVSAHPRERDDHIVTRG
ncbi:hypothetical protein SAMN05216571_11728 [Onishia taeanensis]|uniref:Uncharacterized protein n=1 Tax=Onishia taeanensis TaxID=284577 RepID=A0A1G7UWV2_9GAMM|nr:hypothetical protein SAMN05216571_11728 [Halomonas taeanensis]